MRKKAGEMVAARAFCYNCGMGKLPFLRLFLLSAGLLWLLMATLAPVAGAAARTPGQLRGKTARPQEPADRYLRPKPPAPYRPDERFLSPPARQPLPPPAADFGRRRLAPYPAGERIRICTRYGGELFCYDDPYPRIPRRGATPEKSD
ncbi:MAG: hypothetical protein WCY68_02055 [Desulfuromonadales bacterium]